MNDHDLHHEIRRAEKLIESGNHRDARAIAKNLRRRLNEQSIREEEALKIERLLKITGFDPVIIGAFVLTFATIVFLYLKYAF